MECLSGVSVPGSLTPCNLLSHAGATGIEAGLVVRSYVRGRSALPRSRLHVRSVDPVHVTVLERVLPPHSCSQWFQDSSAANLDAPGGVICVQWVWGAPLHPNASVANSEDMPFFPLSVDPGDEQLFPMRTAFVLLGSSATAEGQMNDDPRASGGNNVHGPSIVTVLASASKADQLRRRASQLKVRGRILTVYSQISLACSRARVVSSYDVLPFAVGTRCHVGRAYMTSFSTVRAGVPRPLTM